MKFSKKKIGALVIAFLFVTILSLFRSDYSSFAAQKNSISFNGKIIDLTPEIVSGTTFVPVRKISEILGIKLLWEGKEKTAFMISPKGKVTFKLGVKKVSLNGIDSNLIAAPYIKNGKVYIPLRALVKAIGYDLNLNRGVIEIKTNDVFIKSTYGELTVWVNYSTRTIYYSKGISIPIKVETALPKFKGKAETLKVSARQITDSIIVSIHDYYGDPLIREDNHQVLINDKKVVRKTFVENAGSKSSSEIISFNNYAVMLDASELFLVESSGEIIKKFDLEKLLQQGDSYTVEGIYEDLLLVRANTKSILVGYDLDTSRPIIFYKELLSVAEQKMIDEWDPMDINYPGDQIMLIKREGNSLFFERKGQTYNFTMN
jgi:hypothetical protein